MLAIDVLAEGNPPTLGIRRHEKLCCGRLVGSEMQNHVLVPNGCVDISNDDK